LAEIADKYCKKGTKVYIEGELQTNKYKDKTTGEEKYSTQVVFSFLFPVFKYFFYKIITIAVITR
jgi:single-stranded DNA-binding protein